MCSVELAEFVDDHLVELVLAIIKERLIGNVYLGRGQRHLLLDQVDLLLDLNLLFFLLDLLLTDFLGGTLSVRVRDVYLTFRCILCHNLSNLLNLVVFENVIVHGESLEAGLSGEKSEQRGHALVLITSEPLALL